jgi:hypothetical protein
MSIRFIHLDSTYTRVDASTELEYLVHWDSYALRDTSITRITDQEIGALE